MASSLQPGAEVPIRSQSVRTRRPPTTSRPEPTPRSESSTRIEASRQPEPKPSSSRPYRSASKRSASQTQNQSQESPRPPNPQPEMSNGTGDGSAGQPARPKNRVRNVIATPSGNYNFVKTIGQGSMGKVKLAKKEGSGELVACKIIERVSPDDGRTSREERDKADQAREIRNSREAAIVSLLHHPYICELRDSLRTRWHWYMLFEYVNGGQMLDYIISHGKLREKQARKFARQIASAIDYCHRNSIVHRDLKIENILIHKNGDIKIIDFGLSNLFAPHKLLHTFCGSLYFAAPELLQARPYPGPEVDVWSFGVVLFVLVCGKVPFDDQYMPALHAKIKKGVIDYPQGLSSECKHLISRMLVTDPKQRATMQEVMTHPWMLKGYGTAPDNYLPKREPLTFPLDQDVIKAMTGFGFGAPEEITHKLTTILESKKYQECVVKYEKENEVNLAPKDPERRGGFGFGFYNRRKSVTSRETLNASSDGLPIGHDPLNAYHPMISIYYLVWEKLDRDAKESGEVREPPTPSKPQAPPSPKEPTDNIKPASPRPKEKHSLAEITPPQPAHTETRTRQRTRSHSEDQTREPVKNGFLSPDPTPAEKGGMAGLLRRISTRNPRRKDPSESESGGITRGALSMRAPKTLGHARRESIAARRAKREAESREQQANEPPPLPQVHHRPRREEAEPDLEQVDGPEAVDPIEGGDDSAGSNERLEPEGQQDLAKPVFLKGIFSVSTTSTRPLLEIRADIKRVLKQLGVDYKEIKGGFSCTHTPSVVADPASAEQPVHKTVIKFEILIVKVPIVSLHGVQFKRVGGDTWQYKEMAELIVKDLKL